MLYPLWQIHLKVFSGLYAVHRWFSCANYRYPRFLQYLYVSSVIKNDRRIELPCFIGTITKRFRKVIIVVGNDTNSFLLAASLDTQCGLISIFKVTLRKGLNFFLSVTSRNRKVVRSHQWRLVLDWLFLKSFYFQYHPIVGESVSFRSKVS